MVTLLELVESLALVGFNHIRDKLLGVDVENFGARVISQQLVADGMDQVGLAQADPAIDEQRVVELPDAAGHMHGRRPAHAIGRAFDQGLKGQCRIEPGLDARGRFIGGHQAQWLGQWTQILIDRTKFDGLFFGSDY